MNMKHSMLCTAMLLAAVLAGCKEKKTAEEKVAAPPTTAEEAAAPKADNAAIAREVRELINQLHAVDATVISSDRPEDREKLAIVNALKRLQQLTGRKFYAPTAAALPTATAEEKFRADVLRARSPKLLPFFVEGSAISETLILAPVDTQEQIIRNWQDWYERCGADFDYASSGVMD